MLVLRAGCKVPFPEKLSEEYMLIENQIIANISADKIKDIMNHFIYIHEEPVFFILELPSKQDDEEEIQPGIVEKMHKDVYYIDECTGEEAFTILLRIGDLMINDGLCSFGFGCHESEDEIVFGKYNVTTILSKNINRYNSFMAEHEIAKSEYIVTAWDTFSQENPGISERIETGGKDIYSIPEMFADWGIYKAEQREC